MRFLTQNGWDNAVVADMQGDASTRRYSRITQGDRSAVLMQDPNGDVAVFARLSRQLSQLGISTPEIYAQDTGAGLLLIEDFGDAVLAGLAQDPDHERDLYLLATDVLLALHRHPPLPDLRVATAGYLADAIDLAFLHYTQAPKGFEQAKAALLPALKQFAHPADVTVLRDYHAENALLLPARPGLARLGVLDFQDALQGHRAYDLVSLIQDARRDVSPATAEACITHYLTQSDVPEAPFRASLAVLGAQRNLRILGIFARLAQVRGKPSYIDLIPRVWDHLQNDLRHPALSALKSVLDAALPRPNAEHLQRLKSTCPTP